MDYNYNNITGSVLLRADSNSQITNVFENGKHFLLVDENQFWGTKTKKGLYYDYREESNSNGYCISYEDWDDYSNRSKEKLSIERTEMWLDERITKYNQKNICVIQGYAGCGKTTFVNSILRRARNLGSYSEYYNFYIGYLKDQPEEMFILSSIQDGIIKRITDTLQEQDGLTIYDQFCNLFQLDLELLNPIFSSFFPLFSVPKVISRYSILQKKYLKIAIM